MNKKILHLFDDAIIAQSVIDLYKKTTHADHRFAIIINANKASFKVTATNEIVLLPNDKHLSKAIRHLSEGFDAIFFEALSFEKAKALWCLPKKEKKMVWVLWGYELYNLADYYGLFSEKEIKTTVQKNGFWSKIRNYYTFSIVYPQAIKKIDFFVFLLKYDFSILNRSIPIQGQHISLCYQTIDNLFPGKTPFKISGTNIMIGNSSTPSNNHSSVFNGLKNANLNNRKVIVPLSYGDSEYRKRIMQEGATLFGSQFSPILDFMTLDDYSHILSSCSHVVMAHDRQQSFGTIAMMLIAGAKVFLKQSNPLYNWFVDQNVILFPIDENMAKEMDHPLSEAQTAHNTGLLQSLFSEKKTIEQLDRLISLV